MLTLKHLTIEFKQKKIFQDTSFQALDGYITGIVGPSGSGKSTLLKSLLYKQKVELYFNDIKIDEYNKNDYILENISYIDQFGSFFNNMTIQQHFQWISDIRHCHFDEQKMLNSLDQVELNDIQVKNYPSCLSIGQRKRFLIALALYKDSQVIIFDEPTASLDETTKKTIIALMKKLKETGKCLIVTSHDETLIRNMDIIYTIKDCKLITDKNLIQSSSHQTLNVSKPKVKWNYFLYKNSNQRFQFILTILLGIIMTVSLSISICDGFLQENSLSTTIERTNKAEIHVAKMNELAVKSGMSQMYCSGSQEELTVLTKQERKEIEDNPHVVSVHPFDTIDTINQGLDVYQTTVKVNSGEKVTFDWNKEQPPLIIPYYSFENIKVNGKELKGTAITKSMANKLSVKKNDKVTMEVYVPVEDVVAAEKGYYYPDDHSDGVGVDFTKYMPRTKKVEVTYQIDNIVNQDEYYTQFLQSGNCILLPEKEFFDFMNSYKGMHGEEEIEGKKTIQDYTTKEYVLEIDNVKNIRKVESDLKNMSDYIVCYDDYTSVIDETQIYKQSRKDRIMFMCCVIIVAIVLFSMVMINSLDAREKEISLFNINGLSNKYILKVLKQNMIVQSVMCIIASYPIFNMSRKMGFFVVNTMNLTNTLVLFSLVNVAMTVMIYMIYILYCHYLVKKVTR